MHGLLLAAGAGSRMGMPKALVRADDGEPWLVRGVRTLVEGGCAQVTVVLGASAEEALPLLEGAPAPPASSSPTGPTVPARCGQVPRRLTRRGAHAAASRTSSRRRRWTSSGARPYPSALAGERVAPWRGSRP